jgi:hypothetical protein
MVGTCSRCIRKTNNREVAIFTIWAGRSYDALRQVVERFLRRAAQPLTIHVADAAILRNHALRKLCRRTGSQIVWLPSVEVAA